MNLHITIVAIVAEIETRTELTGDDFAAYR